MFFHLQPAVPKITAQESLHKKTFIAEGLIFICKLRSYPSKY